MFFYIDTFGLNIVNLTKFLISFPISFIHFVPRRLLIGKPSQSSTVYSSYWLFIKFSKLLKNAT